MVCFYVYYVYFIYLFGTLILLFENHDHIFGGRHPTTWHLQT